MKILIVDDDSICLDILSSALTADGHEVVAVTDGVEALDKLVNEEFRIVISDWMMPNLDGLDLCRHIRTMVDGLKGYVYIVLLTSRNTPEDIAEGLKAGADDFLVKPFQPIELQLRVKAAERVVAMETQHLTIFALAKLAESRDPETGFHLERIREYSRLIAQHLANQAESSEEINLDFANMVYLTSPLHDIGKVGLPDCVLLKPSRLSEDEFDLMTQHTIIGAATLDMALERYPQAEFLKMARDIALSHHERFDGTGYPYRLAGADIPLAARIVALADVYDALTSKRVYKPAFDMAVSKSIILSESGSHFDPQVVKAFQACEKQFLEIRLSLESANDISLSLLDGQSSQ